MKELMNEMKEKKNCIGGITMPNCIKNKLSRCNHIQLIKCRFCRRNEFTFHYRRQFSAQIQRHTLRETKKKDSINESVVEASKLASILQSDKN